MYAQYVDKLAFVVDLYCVGFINPLDAVAGVWRQRLALRRTLWAQLGGFHLKTETGPVFETLYFK
jgi:hypothetical protein